MDAALLPTIGSYQPRWFMSVTWTPPRPCRPSKTFVEGLIPQQWGVFDLTDEPMDLPPKDYRKAAGMVGLTEEQTPIVPHGGTDHFQQ